MTDDGYDSWLRPNPPPDLQELVARHGCDDKITPEAWAEYDRAMAAWQEARRSRHAGDGRTSNVPNENNAVTVQGVADREALCICGLRGVYSRPRKGGGRPIWRCEEHRDRWPDYAVEVPGDSIKARSIADYDATDDFSRSIDEAYAEIRNRVAAGGEPWKPR